MKLANMLQGELYTAEGSLVDLPGRLEQLGILECILRALHNVDSPWILIEPVIALDVSLNLPGGVLLSE